MSLPSALKTEYAERLDELIREGDQLAAIYGVSMPAPAPPTGYHGRAPLCTEPHVRDVGDPARLTQWLVNGSTLLGNLIPPDHVHAGWRSGFSSIDEYRKSEDIRKKIGFLRAIRDDFSRGLLDSLDRRIEGIIAADYMGQAENLLSESATGKYDHVPAAVLAGAVLEKFLRSLCASQSPQVPVTGRKGRPLKVVVLIDGLKQAGAIDELTAKHLRAYAGTRNKAAHGEFDDFKRTDVELMLKGINDFLAEHAENRK